jgi:hypothetical protein
MLIGHFTLEQVNYKYSIPYLIFLGYLFVLMFWEFNKLSKQQSTKGIRMLTILGFLFFFGLRGYVFSDWYGYEYIFQKLPTLWSGNLVEGIKNANTDIGFCLYSVIIKSICPNYFFWTFISSFIDVVLLDVIFRRYSRYYVFAFVVFFAFAATAMEFNLMRNVKAILLFFISLKYLQERRVFPYMLLNVLGILFHISAIVYIPLYFFLHRKLSETFWWIVFVVGNIIFLFPIKYAEPLFTFFAGFISDKVALMIERYFNNTEYLTITFGYIERIVTFVLVMLCYKKLIQQNKSNLMFINIYMLYFVAFFFFSEVRPVQERLSYLFVLAYAVIYPNMLAIAQRQRKLNWQLYIMVLVVFFMLKIVQNHSDIFARYHNIVFEKQDVKQEREFWRINFYYGKTAEEIEEHSRKHNN